jgi:hypothetical protein
MTLFTDVMDVTIYNVLTEVVVDTIDGHGLVCAYRDILCLVVFVVHIELLL